MNEEFSIMGIIVDEIEDIIQDYYPGKCFSVLNLYMLMDFSFFLYILPGARFRALLAGVHCTLRVAG